MPIERARLLLSAQRALLGHIGDSILATSVTAGESSIELTAFTEAGITSDEKEALDNALAEIVADFPQVDSAELHIISEETQPFKSDGHWLFIRLGVQVA